MNDSVYRVSLEVQQLQLGKIFYAKQGDTARRLEITLTDGGLPYRIAEGCWAVLTATKPSGMKFYGDCQIQGNKIIFEVEKSGLTDTAGEMMCEVTVYSGEKQLTAAAFGMIVDAPVYIEGDLIEEPKRETRVLLSPFNAKVGQYLRIAEVAANGMVKKLEAVDGGAGYTGPMIPAGMLYGDVDGDGEVTAKDSRLLTLYLSGEVSEAELRLELADVNADGVVDEADVELIVAVAAGTAEGFDAGVYANWTADGDYFYYDLTVGGITEGMAVTLLAPGAEIVKTESHEGYIRLFVTEVPKADVPYSLHFDNACVKTVNGVGPDENGNVQIEAGVGNGVKAVSVTEAADGTVTMVNTLEEGTETIVITPDESGNPNKLTYNGKEIPISWAVSE